MVFEAHMRDIQYEAEAKGRAEDKNEEKLATAKRMLALGKSLQDIELITNLPLTTIKNLQTEML